MGGRRTCVRLLQGRNLLAALFNKMSSILHYDLKGPLIYTDT